MNGSRSFQELVNETKLHRSTVAANLKLLLDMGIVEKRRVGKEMMYDSKEDNAEVYSSIILSPNWQKELENARRIFRWDKRFEAAISLAWLDGARKYEKEILDLQSTGIDLQTRDAFEVLRWAKERRRIKQELDKIMRPQKSATKERLRLPSTEAHRKEVVKSRVEELLRFARDYPDIVARYRETIRKKLKEL